MTSEKTVILLEDDQDIADLLCQLITSYGATPVLCQTEAAVLDSLTRHRVSLALLDIMLPGVDGRKVAAALRAANVRFPVYFMTGMHPSQLNNEELKLADGLLRKPFSIVSLRDLLDSTFKPAASETLNLTNRRRLFEIMTSIATERENIRRQKIELDSLVSDCRHDEKHKELGDRFEAFSQTLEASLERFADGLTTARKILDSIP